MMIIGGCSEKLFHFADSCWYWSVDDAADSAAARENALAAHTETQEIDLSLTELALVNVDFQIVFGESLEDFLQVIEMF